MALVPALEEVLEEVLVVAPKAWGEATAVVSAVASNN